MTTTTERLMQLAEAATPGPWEFVIDGCFAIRMPKRNGNWETAMCDTQYYYPWCPERKEDWEHIAAANPETIKRMVELLRIQHEAIIDAKTTMDCEWGEQPDSLQDKAIAAFDKFDRGE